MSVNQLISSLGNERPVDKRIIGSTEARLIHNLEKNPFLLETDEKKYDATVLHEAARHEYEEYATKIIGFYPSFVSSVNVDGDTPLHFAARTGNTSILVKMLESRKAAFTKINKQGETAFIIACVNNHVDAAIILVEEATSMTMVELNAAFSAHHPVIVDKILERFPDLVTAVDKEKSTLLHKACKVGNLEMVRKLLEVDQSIAEIVNKDGLTPLHYAAMNGSVEILEEFLDKAPSSFITTTQGTMETVFHLAIKQKNTEAFIFMAQSANIGKLLYNLDAEGSTVLHVAARNEYEDYVTKIIELYPSLVSSVNVDGDTPLHFAARTGNTSILVKMLESSKEACTKINKQGETAFIIACVNNHVDAAIILVEEATSMTMMELDAAFSAHHPGSPVAIPDIILEKFPALVFAVDEQKSTLLHKACLERNLEMVKMLLDVDHQGIAAETMNKNGLTPLHCAAMTGSVEILKEFLERTPSSFNVTTQGTMETVFHLAAKQKHIKAFTFMAESANIDKHLYRLDAEDNTVLHVAASVNSKDLVHYILSFTTIVVTLKNKNGSEAVDLLDQNGEDFGQLSDWLRKAEKKIQRPYVTFAREAGEHNRNTSNGELLNSVSIGKNLVTDPRTNKEREMHRESLQNVRNTITIVAVLIASVAFTSGITPPGGIYQDGDLIGKATAGKTLAFKIFSIANNIALFTSLSIVTLLVSIISYRTSSLKMYVVIAHKMMWLAVASMVTSYTAAAWITVPHSKGSKWLIYTTAAIATVPIGSMFVYVTFLMVKHILKKQSLRGNESQGKPASTIVELKAAEDTGHYGC